MNWIVRWQARRYFKQLRKADSRAMARASEDRAVQTFHDAVQRVPAYSAILAERGIDPGTIANIHDFSRLPILKKDVFERFEIEELCRDGNLDQMRSVMISSGFSNGIYSLGMTSHRSYRSMENMTDALLDHAFGSGRKKTFLINALGMGTRIFTSLPMAETSVRADMVVALVKKLSCKFEQIIIVAGTYFAKRIAEDGVTAGVWGKTPVHFVIGEDWFPESFRDYLMWLTGIDSNRSESGSVISSMGVCEVGLSLFRETPQTIAIRRLAEKDEALRKRLFGDDCKSVPMLFQYDPMDVYMEVVNGELTFTTLGRNVMVPLIRYQTGDLGQIYSHDEIRQVMGDCGAGDLVPELKLPLVAVAGRSGRAVDVRGAVVTPELVKDALYSDDDMAANTTGYFRIVPVNSHVRIEVQLKEGAAGDLAAGRGFGNALARVAGVNCEVELFPYREFSHGVGLIYEEKFRYT